MHDGRLQQEGAVQEVLPSSVQFMGPTLQQIWVELQEIKEFLRRFEEFFLQEEFLEEE